MCAALDALPYPHVVLRPVIDPAGHCTDLEVLHLNRAALSFHGALPAVTAAEPGQVGAESLAGLMGQAMRQELLELVCDHLADDDSAIVREHAFRAAPEPGKEQRVDVWMARVDDAVVLGWRDVTPDFEARQKALSLDSASIGMAIVGPDRLFADVNRSLCDTLGFRRSELLGKSFTDITHPDDLDLGMAAVAEILAGSRDSFNLRKRYLSKCGDTVWMDLHVAAVRDDRGRLLHMVAQLVNVTAEVLAAQAYERSRQRFQTLAENASDVVIEIDRQGSILWAAPSLQEVFGFDPAALMGTSISNLVDPDDLDLARTLGTQLLDSGHLPEARIRFRARQGRTYVMAVKATITRDQTVGDEPDGGGVIVLGLRDVTERVAAEHARERSEWLLAQTIDDAPSGMALAGSDGRFLRVNRALCSMLAVAPDAIIGRRVEDFVADETQSWRQTLVTLSDTPDATTAHAHFLMGHDRPVWVRHAVSVLREADGSPVAFIHQFIDLSEMKELHDQLLMRATLDGLTGLPNRAHLDAALAQQLDDASEGDHTDLELAVFFCDLDHLKTINDEHGHLVGDAVLTVVGKRIAHAVRPADVVARYGGDEFVVLAQVKGGESTLPTIGERIRSHVAEPVVVGDEELHVSLSIGMTLADAGEQPADVLARADGALYRAKGTGRDCAVLASAGA